MTKVIYDKKHHSVEVIGHAGYARTGHDIVCAACSALSIALAARSQDVEGYHAVMYSNAEQAVVSVSCSPNKECAHLCEEMLNTIMAGFTAISEQFPAYIEITVKE